MSTRASIILPIYRSETTLRRSLVALREQQFRDFELILVDSGPDRACERIAAQAAPQANYIRAANQLLAHEATDLGVERASGDSLVFIDPDAYARPDWLAKLMAASDEFEGPVIGGVACHGDRWIDLGAHLCKFDKWLSGAKRGWLKEGPTVNFLLPRPLYKRFGPFAEGQQHADTMLCWHMHEAGVRIRFEPAAVVEHHHLHSWPSLLAERCSRGRSFAELLIEELDLGPAALAWKLAKSALPLRLVTQSMRVFLHAKQSGMLGAALRTWPVWTTGLYAWLLGESLVYAPRMIE